MNGRVPRGTRATAIAAIVIATWAAPAATAVTPPAVDDGLLPPPRPPAPRTPTEQADACPVATPVTDASVTQLDLAELAPVWRLTKGAGQTVAVIDTGVARHRLLPHLLPGGDYVSTGDGMQDCDGHGTIVAGIIGAARGDATFGGLAPDAGILAVRQSSNVFRYSDARSGSGVGDVETLAAAVRTAADAGATVINISSVACVPADDGLDDRPLGAALAYAVDVKNVVVVTAAGNVGGAGQCPRQNPPPDERRPGQPSWDTVDVVVSPAWYDDYVLTVGSVDRTGRPSDFTLAGPWVDVAAPGEDVVSLGSDGDGLIDTMPGSSEKQPISGTSYAAPVVAGIAALVRASSPGLTARQVMSRIEDTAHPPAAGWDPWVGRGVVDALAAVSADGVRPQERSAPAPLAQEAVDVYVDKASRRVSLIGGAACIAAALVATTSSVGWSRRRRQSVAED
ncbi:type VII secretion-associated serine protease [Mycobacterium antarcticum]|uniref:type VII secretion-associated serine protease mycosin n=1 Tax=unclassified Mycolicibacterium TaxID=2636767 RepID=UPI0023A0DA58|nr:MULTISPECIES: type VII secretion-associated serine protease mycosin [unclassified Mycolicibacterium]BDX34081.1 type VII secretion-associated serine protease [Mycolicibacterium sp. TUM20985]GLP82311.1 type VII secretion-associated serine protease [Mycolicibacterium sp. TUM20984]